MSHEIELLGQTSTHLIVRLPKHTARLLVKEGQPPNSHTSEWKCPSTVPLRDEIVNANTNRRKVNRFRDLISELLSTQEDES